MIRILRCCLLVFLSLFGACRGEDYDLIPVDETKVLQVQNEELASFYLLCEGNMGSNKASLDFYNASQAVYYRNIFSQLNPNISYALGDVGNDILVYGNKLYIVVNASNLVEVMEAKTGKHITQIVVQNPRNIIAHKDKIYLSSYAGPIGIDPNAREGEVVEIDTNSLQITQRATVGYQPDGLCVANNLLYVANSGGYRPPHYDRRLTILSLEKLATIKHIDIALNLNQVLRGPDDKLYISTRGDYKTIAPNIYVFNPVTEQVEDSLNFVATSWWLDEDFLYAVGSQYSKIDASTTFSLNKYDLKRKILTKNFLKDQTIFTKMKYPYAIAVDPHSKVIYITDANNFISSGKLYAFTAQGELKWEIFTGDIPAHFAFVPRSLELDLSKKKDTVVQPSTFSPYITKVYEYCPAPGQFINTMPEATEEDTPETMRKKVLEAIGNNKKGMISLGGWGGYVIVGFDHTIMNKNGKKDFKIIGNAFENSSEPGVVMVAKDVNKNNLPDDPFYELKGSEYHRSTLNYQITYVKPNDLLKDYPWIDNQGKKGAIYRNVFHSQSYYPLWLKHKDLQFKGSLLPSNATNKGTKTEEYWVLTAFDWGYVDNHFEDEFDIANAVDEKGKPIYLDGINFIKVYTGVNQSAGWLGETSTEITNILDINFQKNKND